MSNHVIPTTYFWDAIEAFSFNYVFYTYTKREVNALGKVIKKYDKSTIRGSLQAESGFTKQRDKSGSTVSATFKFYCKSIYRVNVDDFIQMPNGQFLICTGVTEPYDEYGVRAASFSMTDLSNHKDLQEYIDFLEGKKLL